MYDRSRGKYSLKEASLGKAILTVFNLPPTSPEAENLKNWRNPTSQHYDQGDFSLVAFKVISPRSTVVRGPNELGPSLLEIDQKLDALVEAKDSKESSTIFSWFMHTLLPMDLKWLIRIILMNLRLGISDKCILGMWHQSAHKVWATSSDLHAIAQLTNQAQICSPDAFQIQVMTPFLPMLGYKAHQFEKLPGLIRKFNKPFYLQEKIDGERIVIHYQHGQFKFYSRKAVEWMHYGTDMCSGSWSAFAGQYFDVHSVHEFILDGEMVSVDSVTHEVLPFGTVRSAHMSVSASKPELLSENGTNVFSESLSHPRFFCFDLLWLNGKPLLDLPLRDRHKLLKTHFTPFPHRFDILPMLECNNIMDIIPHLQDVYVDKGEGLVVKDPNSIYEPGERPTTWLKIKVDYQTELLETMDLIVIGGNWGRGKREGMFSAFLLALRNPQVDANGNEVWSSFVRVGSGYSNLQAEQVSEMLIEYATPFQPTNIPSWLNMGKNSAKVRPDMVVHPHHSMVFEVVAAQITESSEYAAGYTLRFPRILRFRNDKGYADADTLDDLTALINKTGGGRLVKAFTQDIFSTPKRTHKPKKGHQIASTFVPLSEYKKGKVSSKSRHIFNGWTFLIVSKPTPQTKASHPKPSNLFMTSSVQHTSNHNTPAPSVMSNDGLHQLIRDHGGTCIAGLTINGSLPSSVTIPDQFLVVAMDTTNSFKVSKLIAQDKYDIITPAHLSRCVSNRKWTDPSPADYLHITTPTRIKHAQVFDCWGDHMTNLIPDTQSLKRTLMHMDAYQFQNESMSIPAWKLFAMPFTGIDQDEQLAPFDARVDEHDNLESLLTRDRRKKRELIEQFRAKYSNDRPLTNRWFSGMVVYPHWYQIPGNENSRKSSPKMRHAILRLVFYGAEVTSALYTRSNEITHILIQNADDDISGLGVTCRIVSLDWVSACCDAKTMVAEFINRPSTLGTTLNRHVN